MGVKPPYAVPSMAEIREYPPNGYSAISTFSGCGGSSLGYRMAGFRVVWASEFIAAARDTYRANAAEYTTVDGRDIRDVTGQDVLDSIGLDVGELDLMDGSPPCSAFSTAGKRQAGWNQVKKYSDSAQRVDDLFFEYARLVRDVQPRVFVAENVSGLVKGAAKGYFLRILQELKRCGYRVKAKLLDAQWLGVPQARQRLIFIGVRDDLGMDPVFPSPLPYRYTVRDALPWIDQFGTAPPHAEFTAADRDVLSTMRPANSGAAPTVMASGLNKGAGLVVPRAAHDTQAGAEVTRDPETGKDITIGRYAIGREWSQLAPGQKSDRYLNLVRSDRDKPAPTVTAAGGNMSAASVTHPVQARKFTLGELRAICGYPADFELTGTYEQRWERLGRSVPPVMMSHIAATVRDNILNRAREK